MILHCDIFWFSLGDEEFVSKAINDGNVDLEKFPASRVRQHAKKMESLKATAKHIKQVAGDPQLEQINLMRHQHMELSSGKHKKKKPFIKSRQPSHKNASNGNQQVSSHYKKSFDPMNAHKRRIDVPGVGIQPMWKAFSGLQKNLNIRLVTSLDPLQSLLPTKKYSAHA